MTTPTFHKDPATVSERATWRVRDRGVIRSELTKFRSVRSNVITLIAAAAVLVGFGILFSSIAGAGAEGGGGPQGPGQGDQDSLAVAFAGLNLAQLILGVLGALVVTSEYSSGLIRSMFAVVPKRIPVLRAKVAVVGLGTWVMMTAAAFVTFFLAQSVYAGEQATYTIGDSGVLRVVLGVGAYGAGVALMGLALGFLLRSTAAAVASLIGLLMVAPGLSGLLPDSVGDTVTKILPSNAGSAFTELATSSDQLSPGAGFAVFAAWVVGLLVLAGWALLHRDA